MQIGSTLFKKVFLLAACWIGFFIGMYLLLALFFFTWTTKLFPLSTTINYLFKYPGDQILLEYTKSHSIPQNYIAVFGDSYAAGLGDGLYSLQHNNRPEYNALHFVYKEKKGDIVSFGMPASSNLKSFIEDPLSQLYYLEETTSEKVFQPSQIILYFYEGNDLDDNYVEVRDRLKAHGYSQEDIANYNRFSNEVVKTILDKNPQIISARAKTINDLKRPYLYLMSTVQLILSGATLKTHYRSISVNDYEAGSTNKIVLSKKVIGIPDLLQGPAMSLSSDQIDVAMMLLDQSIMYTRQHFHHTPISIIYIPSAATIYQFNSPNVHLWDIARISGKNYFMASAPSIRKQSNSLCRRVMSIAEKHGLLFHDSRKSFAAAGATQLLHGPIDWWHFNLEGQRLLANELAKVIDFQTKSGAHTPATCFDFQ